MISTIVAFCDQICAARQPRREMGEEAEDVNGDPTLPMAGLLWSFARHYPDGDARRCGHGACGGWP